MTEQHASEGIEDIADHVVSRSRRAMRKDRFVLVLVLIVLTILSTAVLGDGIIGRVTAIAFLLATLLVSLGTSDASPILRWVGIGVAVFAVVAILGAETFGHVGLARLAYVLAMATVGVLTPIVIARRIACHPTINTDTVAGAADIYLLTGLLFAVLYGLMGAVHAGELSSVLAAGQHLDAPRAFFVAARPTTPGDFVYYSFVTLTTVGYGDLTSALPMGRMLSITEALLGQLYLVTVVALVVANVGRSRRPKADGSDDSSDDAG